MELGRININVSAALLSQYLVSPREGHLEQVCYIFGYSGRTFYPDAKEPRSHNAPEECSNSVQINTFVDANHAGDHLTRRSHAGILIFINRAPII